MHKQSFAVDAALLHELGERLIGRPAIALGELIKNSFDADATTCRVEFRPNEIVVSDDGVGMSSDDFVKYWMRLGTTHKVEEGRTKKGRLLTGSKGIGRLSAQFLAAELTLESTAGPAQNESVYAIVDWRNVVRGSDLSRVRVDWDYLSQLPRYPNGSATGTRIVLGTLKTPWNADALRALGDDVWMLRSPFRSTKGTPRDGSAQDFEIEIEAPDIADARDAFDDRFRKVFAQWKARITGKLENGRGGGTASVSVEFRKGYPDGSEKATTFRESIRLPISQKSTIEKALVDRANFDILIFKPEGRQPSGIPVLELRQYLARFGNVSVYDAGFRLPYYGAGREDATGQDWLSIAVDQGRRLNISELLPAHLRTQNRYMQDLPAPGRIFGAVEINTNHERSVAQHLEAAPDEWLQIQPGRDRLHDNRAFEQLRDLVRFSLDFYANRFRLLDLQVTEKVRDKEPPSRKYSRVMRLLETHKRAIPARVFGEVKREIEDARKATVATEDALDRRAALLAPLASAGMSALALNHEIARESSFLRRIGLQLRQLASDRALEELGDLADEIDEARTRLDSLREIFAPLLSDADKSATDRLRVRSVVDHVVSSMRILMPGVAFDQRGIPKDLRFPLGSLAEWNAILQNVLSNAWNAMLDSERFTISFRGGRNANGTEWLRISDSGQGLGVSLSEASELFEPFERRLEVSPDKRSIAMGGQGLGLAIVRMIARRRSATVAFVSPETGFSTTIEMSWKGARK